MPIWRTQWRRWSRGIPTPFSTQAPLRPWAGEIQSRVPSPMVLVQPRAHTSPAEMAKEEGARRPCPSSPSLFQRLILRGASMCMVPPCVYFHCKPPWACVFLLGSHLATPGVENFHPTGWTFQCSFICSLSGHTCIPKTSPFRWAWFAYFHWDILPSVPWYSCVWVLRSCQSHNRELTLMQGTGRQLRGGVIGLIPLFHHYST